ncbi:MAG: hypothetical protein ACE37F_14115 [Nannocystaceae bacterium]|nr:hypothetical protein [bacterium]
MSESRAQPIVSAGEPFCAHSAGEKAVHAFGAFDPFGVEEWGDVFYWHWGRSSDREWLYSLRFEVLSSLRTGGPLAPVGDPAKNLASAASRGHLRFRVEASRLDGREPTDFYCDASGVDIYARDVRVELYAPDGIDIAGDEDASQGGGLGVLDEYIAPSVTRIGSALRPVATLHTYAAAASLHPVPPRAQRYAVLSGETPDLLVGNTTVMANAPATGPIGGVDGLRVEADSIVAWEVAP